jgi:hypothetical protein
MRYRLRHFALVILLFSVSTPIAAQTPKHGDRKPPVNPCHSKGVALTRPFTKAFPAYGFLAALPSLDKEADSSDAPKQSKLILCENGKELGPAHGVHAEIGQIGTGKYSHWTKIGIIFSASDNSDPNVNGRTYKAVMP